ncbi:MAG TPA: hypothetical protein VMQ62_04570 [Dongiaceae bacterium]|nr:hypothetical protein [Dongiaceae bacterium]
MTTRAFQAIGVAVMLTAIPASLFAQSGPSHTLSEHVFNAGGRPAQAVTSASTSFRLSLDSIGESIASRTLSGASFRLGGGLAMAYVPPGEVAGLQMLADQQTLVWSSEPASTAYNVYTGLLSSLPGGFGACGVARVPGTTASDVTTPSAGTGLFYLITGVNRLREEGTKGYTSYGAERSNPLPCP